MDGWLGLDGMYGWLGMAWTVGWLGKPWMVCRLSEEGYAMTTVGYRFVKVGCLGRNLE